MSAPLGGDIPHTKSRLKQKQMSWLWRSVLGSASAAPVQSEELQVVTPATPQPSSADLLNIEAIVKQLDRYGIVNVDTSKVSIGDIIGSYSTDFVFSAKKRDPASGSSVYNTALDIAKAWPDSSVLLITLPNEMIWETAMSGGHPGNMKVIIWGISGIA